MKKIVMGLAAVAMAASMFAADPAFNPSLAEYSGNASVKWGVNLDDGTTGFTNAASATLKFNLFTAGDKATSGDGIWADMKIKNDGNDANGNATDPAMKVPAASVDYAKFHIYDLYIGIMSGDTTVGGITPLAAVESATVALAATGVNKTDGIVIGYNSDLIDVAVDFRSAQGYTNDYAIAAEATVKPIDGLELKAGVSSDFDSVAYAGSVAYKIAMGDNYLKPMAGYTGVDGAANDITTGVIYAWGAQKDSALPYFVTGKVNPGVSVVFDYALDGTNDMTIIPSFYLGDDIVENLSCGAYAKIDVASDVTYEVAADVKYTIKADDVSIATKLGTKYAADKLALKAGIDVTGLVNNTTFSIDYASTDLLTPVKGTLDFTAKISL